LTITSIAFGDPHFEVVGVSAPVTIGPLSSASWTIRLLSPTAGSISNVLRIGSNDPAVPTLIVQTTATVSGSTQQPRIAVTATLLDFGTVVLGGREERTVTISNLGGTARFTLRPGDGFDLNIVFQPNAAGEQTGNVQIVSNDSSSPAMIKLVGIGK
jgi:hypothetical protein